MRVVQPYRAAGIPRSPLTVGLWPDVQKVLDDSARDLARRMRLPPRPRGRAPIRAEQLYSIQELPATARRRALAVRRRAWSDWRRLDAQRWARRTIDDPSDLPARIVAAKRIRSRHADIRVGYDDELDPIAFAEDLCAQGVPVDPGRPI
jgi:hypothetical protein